MNTARTAAAALRTSWTGRVLPPSPTGRVAIVVALPWNLRGPFIDRIVAARTEFGSAETIGLADDVEGLVVRSYCADADAFVVALLDAEHGRAG